MVKEHTRTKKLEKDAAEYSSIVSKLTQKKADNEEKITTLREFKANIEGEIIKTTKGPGEFFTVIPPQKHRLIGITDVVLLECSTPEVDDVIRIDDDNGRPDGKIEAEHE